MAFQDLIRYGVNTHQDLAPLGDAAKQGFLEGEQRVNQMKDRAYLESERKRLADEREQEELDAYYGDLYVPPTGQQSYDAGVEMMGREWKSEYAALNAAKKAGKIDNDQYIAAKHEIRNRAQTLKAGQGVLNQSYQMYQMAKQQGQVSESTPARIRLLFDSMERGDVQIQNVNGVPTLVGQVADGEPVQIAMSELASGNTHLRFNQKVDTKGLVDGVAQTLEKYKSTVATENGLALGNVGWDMIQERAAHDIDQLLNSQSVIESVGADELGYNHEEIKALGNEELRNRVGDYLLDKVQREYFPTQAVSHFTGMTDYQAGNLALNQQKLNQGLNQQGQPNASLLKFQQDQQQLNQNALTFNNALQTGNLTALTGLGQIMKVDEPGFFGSKYALHTKAGKIYVNPQDPADQQIIANLLGLGSLSQPNQTPSQGAATDESNPLGI